MTWSHPPIMHLRFLYNKQEAALVMVNSIRADTVAASPVRMVLNLSLAPRRGLIVIMSCKQEGGQFSVSSHKCGGKSPSIILANHAAINTGREERRGKRTGGL